MIDPRGRRLGVDVGSVRVGVALCDPDGLVATPLETVPREGAARRIAELVDEHLAVEVVLGLPRTLAGREGPAAEAAQAFKVELEAVLGVPVVLHDERLTTVVATQQLRGRVKGRKQRAVIDQAAAVAILQGYLDTRR
ncbi:Holliday junction resolvase RuvX [Pseudonocardia kujensis]|uniref:Holliday junction resolvase RuvX n=1 Tax=Pseudonocardia kujensis TaxID=1128675 RepID=UPI001E5E3FD8|nr:Holliday junction resolvase RuvX [Pseudonocardia kujensis]MCE0767928.1 Holliday junction resolvase RuvX [Pseudonocardia kujensis]